MSLRGMFVNDINRVARASEVPLFIIWHIIQRLLRQTGRATAALEFAMVAPLFLTCLCFIFETGFEAWSKTVLSASVEYASRQVQIGLITNVTDFKTAVCSRAGKIITLGTPSGSCSNLLQVYATAGISHASLQIASVVGSSLSLNGYSTGGSGSDVLIQVAYPRPFMFPFSAQAVGSSSQMVTSTWNFANEPY
jgi:Flp pilus assembly protein TadG